MQTNMSSVAVKTIKTKSEEKYSGRLLSREMSLSKSSSEIYYGDNCVAIPFMWESQPGTPKVKFPERPIPPLTPPPSYLCSPAKKYGKNHSRASSILHNVFPKLNPRKCQLNHSSLSSWSSSSSSSSSSSPCSSSHSVPPSPFTRRSCRQENISRSRLSFDSFTEEADNESPVSTLCFGTFRSSNARSRGGCSEKVFKLLLGESM